MDGQRSTQSPGDGATPAGPLREIFSDAMRYWEPRRVTYNVILMAVVVAWLVLTWPHFRGMLTPHSLLLLLILAALANACYCAAYMADVSMQYTLLRAAWRRGRWGLWLAGMVLAIALANYWIADEIYPYVR